ncbi:MAG: hypothetical protein PVSMB4_09590 [Ktedonobacterales bacterium]
MAPEYLCLRGVGHVGVGSASREGQQKTRTAPERPSKGISEAVALTSRIER